MDFFRRARPGPAQVDETQDYRATGYTDQRKVARDSRGNLYVAYRKKHRLDGLLRYHIFVARSADAGASWSVLGDAPIERAGDYTQRVPALALGADDVLHIAWYGNDAGNTGENERQIKYARSADGGATWSRWANIAHVPGYSGQRLWQEHPTIYADGAAVYMAWQGLDAAHQAASQAKFAKSLDSGATWSDWRNISPASGNRSRPTIVAAERGARLYVLAYGEVGSAQQIVWSASTDGGNTWAPWESVAPAPADQRHVAVAADSAGGLHAVWREAAGGAARIAYAAFDGRAWGERTFVAPGGAAQQFFPSIAVTRDGTLWAVWTEATGASGCPSDDPVEGRIWYARRPAGGRWSIPTPLTAKGDRSIYASLGREVAGGGVDVVWLNNERESRQQILYARVEA